MMLVLILVSFLLTFSTFVLELGEMLDYWGYNNSIEETQIIYLDWVINVCNLDI